MNSIESRNPGRQISYLYLLLLICPVVCGAILINIYGVNVLFYDEYFIQMFCSQDSNFNLRSLFDQHNEHRIFFPKIIYFVVAKLSDFNSVAVLYASLVVLTGAYLAVNRYAKKNLPYSLAIICPILFGLFMYSPKQYENMFWGFQIGFYMTYAFSVLTLYFASDELARAPKKTNLRGFALAILCGVVASFSSIQGLISWCVVAVVWIMAERTAIFKNVKFYIWCAAACATAAMYFHGYEKPAYNPELTFIFENFAAYARFLLVLVGQPVIRFGDDQAAMAVGLVVIALSLFVFIDYLRCRQVRDFFSISLIVYGVAVSLSISLGRSGFGLEFARFSRYTSFIFLVYIGLSLYCLIRLKPYFQAAGTAPPAKRFGQAVFTLIPAAFFLAMLVSQPDAVRHSQVWKDTRLDHQVILCNFKNETYDQLFYVVPVDTWPEARLRLDLEMLRLQSYNVFAEPGCDGQSVIRRR